MNPAELEKHLAEAVALAERAGPSAAAHFRQRLNVDDNSRGDGFDPVSVADCAVERFLRPPEHVRGCRRERRLRARRADPDHRGAGGVVSNGRGGPASGGGFVVAAGSAGLHVALLAALAL